MKNFRYLFLILVISALLLSVTACNKHKESNTTLSENPLASLENNIQPISQEDLQKLMPPEFFVDPDSDGSISTNSYWLNAQLNPALIHPLSNIRAGVGSGKKILFYTRLNTQWLNFTSELRQMLSDMGYTVEVYNFDNPLPDLSTVDVLAITHCIGTPFSNPNDRPMSLSDKIKIQNFVESGKSLFLTGDWIKSDLPKFNEITSLFGVTMDLNYIDYIVTGRPPVVYDIPFWYSYAFDYVNYYSTNPSQPILKKDLVYGYSCFSNQSHDIFKNVNSVLVMGSSFVRPKVSALAAVRLHPTTSRPREFPIVPEGYPVIMVNEYGLGRYAISCDSNAFANDGFATSVLAGTDNIQFAKNIFNWLAKTPSQPSNSLKIISPIGSSQFQLGESISFTGEVTGTVTNIQWKSEIGEIGTSFPNIATSGFPIGTHTITLSGQTSGRQNISTSTVIYVQPLMFSITFNPEEVRPTGTTDAVLTTITVTMTSAGRPVQNHSIALYSTPVANSGGHFHDGVRPTGVFQNANGITSADGIFSTNYTPSAFGGSETIGVNSTIYLTASSNRDITVRFPNLILLPEQNTIYQQVGGTDAHPGPNNAGHLNQPNTNHWGTQNLIDAIQDLAVAYNAQYPDGPILGFNDMSLPNGGLFDIDADWQTPHNTHREGDNVDFCINNLDNPTRIWVRREILDNYFQDLLDEGDHWHLTSN